MMLLLGERPVNLEEFRMLILRNAQTSMSAKTTPKFKV